MISHLEQLEPWRLNLRADCAAESVVENLASSRLCMHCVRPSVMPVVRCLTLPRFHMSRSVCMYLSFELDGKDGRMEQRNSL